MNHTRPAQGLPNEERVRDREGSVCVREREREEVFVCVRHRSSSSVISSPCLKKKREEKKQPSVEKQQLTMLQIVFTEVCLRCRWLMESRRPGKSH